MNPPAHSRSYKLAKRSLSRPPQKLWIPLFLVSSLIWFGIAFWSTNSAPNLTGCVVSGMLFLLLAYNEWQLIGYRQIFEEQAKSLEEARAAQVPASR